jgi:hypothetical protein
MATNNDRPVKVTCSFCGDTFWADPRDWQALVDHKHGTPKSHKTES